ncbi:hypothetical protein HOK68_03205 [Candidatus Woesearchaeota archaeon]|jgi:hypothetical protein|nr:hypothetical protein [Candidatus Woesearchaeota archaeon]MBT4387578.1 hypothetical protein [Candidatus Woesearchaeota archaeon]MBT4595894.1 hypothetical protein [Candidatus Woesearchaeota archaeon]MBT5741024.1 hypothetical protein [Candidatus Woesearchaeota archaeon]MBT6505761.1 hypothetical protein [Candidatus Woesearchaeota archaeon]
MATSKKKDILKNRGRNRTVRPKTFKNEENAKKYGDSLKNKYEIDKIGSNSRPKYRVKLSN